MLQTDSKTLVMAALLDGPRHGYAIARSMREALGGHQRIERAQIYAALRGLEADGWVVGEWEQGAPARRTYHLTDEGLRELVWRTAEWHACVEAVAEVLPRFDVRPSFVPQETTPSKVALEFEIKQR